MVAAEARELNSDAPAAEVEAPKKPRNLQPVHKIIPKECYDNPTSKGLYYTARDFLVWGGVLTAIYFTDTWWQLIPMWILGGFVVCGLFVLGHDAAHGALFKSKKLTYWVGQLAMLPSLHNYEAWCYGHNRVHHGHTVRQHMDFVWHPITREQWDEMSGYEKLRTRLEWSMFGAFFYYFREIWWKRMMNWDPPPKYKKAVMRDRYFVNGFLLATMIGFGTLGWFEYQTWWGPVWMWTKMFWIPFCVFIHMIGWTVYVHHIHPEIRWWPPRQWNPYKGQMDGTTVIGVGALLNFFWHNIFVHIPHHVDMRIPFYHLPAAEKAIKEHFPDDAREMKLSPMDYIRTTRTCKLYDFEKGEWGPYPG